jgi:hypothetical protein
MVVAIKIRLINQDENILTLIDDAVNQLPKYRVSEINKKASEATSELEIEDKNEYHKTMVIDQAQKSDMILGGGAQDMGDQQSEKPEAPKFAKSLTAKI